MNLKLITIDRLREFLNKFSKVAISGKYSDLSGVPTKVSQFTNDAGYAKVTDIPTVTTYTAGEGIKIENGVISVIPRTKVGNPTCSGYTLYGEYFLSNTITPNKNWNEACAMTESVTVTQNYNYGSAETKTVIAHTLSKAELETIPQEQRKISENGHVWYWTNTPDGDNYAWDVGSSGDFSYTDIDSSAGYGGARLGFRNPFI
jgi:hypothetical protein